MHWLRSSLIFQIALAVYFQAVICFLSERGTISPATGSLNSLARGNSKQHSPSLYLCSSPVLLFAVALGRRWVWAMWFALIGYSVWEALQIESWWIPWIFGPDARALRNAASLARTLKIFPSSPHHLAPDAMHFVLDILLFLVVATLAAGLLRTRAKTT